MPDILIILFIAFSLVVPILFWMDLPDILRLLFFLIPISLIIWLTYACMQPWDYVKTDCKISNVALVNGGKASVVSYNYYGDACTDILPYVLEDNKQYRIKIRDRRKYYAGVWFSDSVQCKSSDINIVPVTAEQ